MMNLIRMVIKKEEELSKKKRLLLRVSFKKLQQQ
jgi:hypothetical protein